MKTFKSSLLLFAVAGCICFMVTGIHQAQAAANESQCVVCHTSPVKLIKITREIAQIRPVQKAAKNKGEG